MNPNNSLIYYENFKYENSPELRSFLESGKAIQILEHIEEQVVLVLGGDGTMLSAVHKHHDKNIPFVGVNFGHKGFLLGDTSILDEKEFVRKTYPLLETHVQVGDEAEKIFYALNEVNIDAARGRAIELNISLEGKNTISLSGDGLLISTPAGSTAYSRSLGGPIIPHEIPAFLLTPKAPWKPRGQAPIVISQDEVIHIENTGRRNAFNMYADSKEIVLNSEKHIKATIRKSAHCITMLVGAKYEPSWDNKVLEEQGFAA